MTAALESTERERAEADAAADAESSDDDEAEADGGENGVRLERALAALERGELSEALSALSASQRAEFERAVQQNQLAPLVRHWLPWWASVAVPPSHAAAHAVTALVTPLSDSSADEEATQRSPRRSADSSTSDNVGNNDSNNDDDDDRSNGVLPPLPTSVPPLRQLLPGRQPSPLLANNLVDLLFVYVHTQRLYNGEPRTVDPISAAVHAVALSAVLSERAVHASPAAALDVCAERSRRPPFAESVSGVVLAFRDVVKVLRCRRFVAAALSDLRSLVSAALESSSSSSGGDASQANNAAATTALNKKQAKRLRAAESKLNFFLSWLAEFDARLVEALHAQVEQVVDERLQQWEQQETTESKEENTPLVLQMDEKQKADFHVAPAVTSGTSADKRKHRER